MMCTYMRSVFNGTLLEFVRYGISHAGRWCAEPLADGPQRGPGGARHAPHRVAVCAHGAERLAAAAARGAPRALNPSTLI